MKRIITEILKTQGYHVNEFLIENISKTRIDELFALEAEKNLDPIGTVVWIYEQARDFNCSFNELKGLVDEQIKNTEVM